MRLVAFPPAPPTHDRCDPDGKRIADSLPDEPGRRVDARVSAGQARPGLRWCWWAAIPASQSYVRKCAAPRRKWASVLRLRPAGRHRRSRTARTDRPPQRRSCGARHPAVAVAGYFRCDAVDPPHRPAQGRGRVPSRKRRPPRVARWSAPVHARITTLLAYTTSRCAGRARPSSACPTTSAGRWRWSADRRLYRHQLLRSPKDAAAVRGRGRHPGRGRGPPGLILGDWVKPGAVVIDVGINRLTTVA